MYETDSDKVHFHAELRPNRSGTIRGIHILFGFLLFVFLPTGVIFVVVGAWPVFGFMGAELLLLYVALRVSHKRGGMVENIWMTERRVTIERVDHWGGRQQWSFQPQWLKVEVAPRSGRGSCLRLRSHGRAVTIGAFLTAEEQDEVANALCDALSGFGPQTA